ncbi:DUF1922 domain-containing protein [Mycobacterium sp. NPDC050041]|uniref:DUF1922 domain-containing protein n=1 Tax=Mycobacterium sp. NPDC050041 TaxID=3364293 RepID=UPI003C2D6F02
MTDCQHCGRPTTLYLCNDCTQQLAVMLDQIPWLLDELDARIQKLDRIHLGTIGRNRRPEELNVMDFDAAETARKTRKKLLHWVTTVATRHTGRQPPGLSTVATKQLALWLRANIDHIARLDIAGKLYNDIAHLVGSDQRGGHLVAAINPTERRFAGTCPTIRGHDTDGEPIECGHMLYADIDEHTIECPSCHQKIDVERNRRDAAASRDLRTVPEILEVLDNLDESVDPKRLDQWIQAKRLRLKGWRHDGALVETRVNEHSHAVYSLERARKLRRRDQQIASMRAKVRAT